MAKDGIYNRYVKRFFDMTFAAGLLLVLLPLCLVIVLVVKLESPGPAVFKQKRLGLNQKPFMIWKFRSMCADANGGPLNTQKNDTRITRVGSFLRRSSLDEIPQLVNVLRGDMSFVGPRPDLKELVFADNRDYFDRFLVRQGITGLAQINGRSQIDPGQRVAYDKYYAHNVSFKLDLSIIYKTVISVILGRGSN